MCASFWREQERRTTSVSPLSCVCNMVPSTLLCKLLISQLEILTCYLILRRTEQLPICMCYTWTWERGKLSGFILIFFQQFVRGCWFGGSYACCPAGELDLLAQGGLWAQEVPCIPCCRVTRSSAGVTSLMFQPFLPSRGFVSVLAVCAGRDVTAWWTDDRHISCHRRRSRGRVTVTWLFPASERKGVAEDGS